MSSNEGWIHTLWKYEDENKIQWEGNKCIGSVRGDKVKRMLRFLNRHETKYFVSSKQIFITGSGK
jgi:hypothetical protein